MMFRSDFGYRKERFDGEYDLLISTCGYETRSPMIARELSNRVRRVVAYTYNRESVHAFAQNVAYFESIGDVRRPADALEFEGLLLADLSSILRSRRRAQVAIDISSFDRERLGCIVRILDSMALLADISVDFLYSEATFDSHQSPPDEAVLVNGPVAGFEGWGADPSVPVACIIGLGFENILALAALETLEPSRTVAFWASSDDDRFAQRVAADNASLMATDDVARVSYHVGSPFQALHQLESVVHTLVRDHRVAIVPLGPKVFALLAILIAHDYGDDVALWRVSAAEGRVPQDREPTGAVISLSVDISARRS